MKNFFDLSAQIGAPLAINVFLEPADAPRYHRIQYRRHVIAANESKPTRLSLLSRLRDPENQAAWREFDETYRDLIVRYCRARGLQIADAEDVRQLVMLRLSKALQAFRYQPERGRFRHYLGRAVRNTIIEQTARPKTRPQPVDTDVLTANAPDEPDDSDALWEQEWMDHHYRLAMKTIRATFDAKSVDVFDRLLEGQSVEELAGAFDMSTQAVHKVKQRIRNRMKELVQQQIHDEDESV